MFLLSRLNCVSLAVTMLVPNILGEAYNVAIIELPVNTNCTQSVDDTLEQNTRNYINLIGNVTNNQSQALDLIIFPESTLTPSFLTSSAAAQLPTTNDIVLCNSTDEQYSRFLKDLSCAAVLHNVTIVINLTEKETCGNGVSDCSKSGEVFYNTNIALGTNGTVMARYRKWNLFGEYGKSKPIKLDLPMLKIRNTTFGMMTCFDIQFGVPGFNLTKDKGIQNIIFPLHWISELPYLTALQVEQMWAQEHNVVLLAAGASQPESGASGSGIFFGNQGPLQSYISSEGETKIMIQSVPVDMQQRLDITSEDNSIESNDNLAVSMDTFFILTDPSIIDHSSVVLNGSKEIIYETVCHGEKNNILCCDFNISIFSSGDINNNEQFESYTYHLVAFNGVRTYSQLYYGGVETCGLIACLNSSVASCGQRFQNYSNIVWPLTFNSISVKGNFTQSDQRVQYPTTLLSSIRPLRIRDYSWEREVVDSTVTRTITLQQPQNRLLTFGIFGRDFERDRDPIRNNTDVNNLASEMGIFKLLIMLTFSSLLGFI